MTILWTSSTNGKHYGYTEGGRIAAVAVPYASGYTIDSRIDIWFVNCASLRTAKLFFEQHLEELRRAKVLARARGVLL